MTHRSRVLNKYDLENKGYSVEELAEVSEVPSAILYDVYDRGIGAYKTNPTSVRMKGTFKKNVKAPMSKKLSKEQWAMARVYSFLDENPKHDTDLQAKIKNYKHGFRVYTASGVPVSRKCVSLERAIQQKQALIPANKELREYSLSNDDIHRMIPTLKIVSYPELLKYKTIDQALDEKGRLMILYLTSDKYTGHWICLLKKGNKIEFFDSYGNLKPDEESEWISDSKLEEFDQDTHYLTKLLRDSPYKIVYNKFPFQSENRDVATCGRHAATRLYFKHLSLPEYTQMVLDSGMAPDDFVTNFTYKLIHH